MAATMQWEFGIEKKSTFKPKRETIGENASMSKRHRALTHIWCAVLAKKMADVPSQIRSAYAAVIWLVRREPVSPAQPSTQVQGTLLTIFDLS